MKTLFAVSNENVSNKIVDSYRKKYGNTLSFKNVFYFNAIIKEIQKDKTYDRIVISEDLEPFANNNYDVIDKFILQRLQEVAEYGINQDGKKIDIIVICTDRRTKSSFVLAKMYELGIYNALVGSDRRIDNVCNLLQEPRTSEEAREYYKIENESTEIPAIDDVTEQEVQNILIHYKKLGKNESRYADSFNNIAAQYTDKQLKIIIKCLPINVRAVLEAECPKYQELVTSNDETEQEKKLKEKIQEQRKLEQFEQEKKLKNRIAKEKKEAMKNTRTMTTATSQMEETKSGIDLLDNKKREARLTGNVLVPNSINTRNERKLYSDEEIQELNNIPKTSRQVPNTVLQDKPENNDIFEKKINNDLPGLEEENNFINNNNINEINSDVNNGINPNTELINNTPTNTNMNTDQTMQNNMLSGLNEQNEINQNSLTQNLNENQNIVEEPVKKGRGRPRKYPVEPPKPKGKRGRPRKNAVPEENTGNNTTNDLKQSTENLSSLPGVDNLDIIQNENNNVDISKTDNAENNANILPGLDDFNNTTTNSNESTLPGFDDLDNNNNSNTLPGFDDLDNNNNSNTLPGFDDLDNNNSNTLPGFDDFDNDNNSNTLPGFDNLDNNNSNTLPGFDDFDNDNNSNTLPGLDNLDNNNNSNTLPGFDDLDNNNSSTLPGIDELNNDSNLTNTATTLTDNDMNLSGIDDSIKRDDKYSNLDMNNNEELEDKIQENPMDNLFEDFMDNPNSTSLPNESNMKQVKQSNNDIADIPSLAGTMNNNINNSYNAMQQTTEQLENVTENKVYQTGALNAVLAKDKKVVAFVGASKNGTSFLVNNLACLFSSIGIKTAILDMTQNKNSYYIYTNNDENLRNIAYTSIEKLENGTAEGIKVDRNLEVYTTIPNDGKDYSNAESILSTLVQNTSLVLIDCDFNTDLGYFANAQEIYLVQSMDILTIQPLTAFLRDLKTKNILDQEKLRVIVNKELKVKNLSTKAVIGGMAFYNDPSMSYMTELFNKDKIKACTIPFDEIVYSKYLESMVNCNVTINGYTKNFMNSLKILGNMVYPLLSKQTYGYKQSPESSYGTNYNNNMNQMKNNF